MKFSCQKCGWCCENIVISVSYSDIHKWFEAGRFDLLQEVSFIANYPRKNTGGFFIAKTAFNPKQPCPFLVKENGVGSCSIQDIKPRACKDYPWSHDKMEGCPAFPEVQGKNLSVRKQVFKSQYKDFKKAFFNRAELLHILTKARNVT